MRISEYKQAHVAVIPITKTLSQSDSLQSWRSLDSKITYFMELAIILQSNKSISSWRAKLPGGSPLSPVALILTINMSRQYGQVNVFLKLASSELYSFLWVIPQHLNFMNRRLGTLFQLHRQCRHSGLHHLRGWESYHTSAYIIQMPGNHPKERLQHDQVSVDTFLVTFHTPKCFHKNDECWNFPFIIQSLKIASDKRCI